MGHEVGRTLEFLPWARNFARSCTSNLPSHLDHEDLQSAGVLAFLQVASRYDEKRGASFRGYCAVRIRGAVMDELRRWDWAPRSVHRVQRRITRVTSSLTECLEREPTQRELAEALGLDENELLAVQTESAYRQLVSLDEATETSQGDESVPLADRLADPSADRPDARLLSREARHAIRQFVGELPKSQAHVIMLHYMQDMPLREVARLLAVTPARISQLHHQGLSRLRTAWDRERQ